MIRTELTPNEIIGWENMRIFTEHVQICCSGVNAGTFPTARLDKEIGAKNREMVAKKLQELRDNGFYQNGISDKGKVRWGVVTRSASLALFDNHELAALRRMPEEDLMKTGRTGYVKIIKAVKVGAVRDYELAREAAY